MICWSGYKTIMLMNPSIKDTNMLFYLKAPLEQKGTVVIHMELDSAVQPFLAITTQSSDNPRATRCFNCFMVAQMFFRGTL